MDCLLNLLAICLFDPSQVFVSGDFDFSPTHYMASPRRDPADPRWEEGARCGDHWCRGPLFVGRVGVTVEVGSKISVDYGFQHKSFPYEEDHGANSWFVKATYRPWGRR